MFLTTLIDGFHLYCVFSRIQTFFEMFCDMKICTFVFLMGVLVCSAASTNQNPIFTNPCVKSCIVTFDYKPFCGSDGYTYSTPSYLGCFQRCNIPIHKAYDGFCNSQQPTYSTSQAPADPTTSNPIFEDQCVKNCSLTYDYRPLCGSDGYDYANSSFIKCFQNCGKPIQKVHDAYCNGQQKFTIPIISQTPTNPSTPAPDPIFEDCMSRCLIRYDYRPLCGSDGRNYGNRSSFNCSQKCGRQVTIAHYGRCKN